MCARRPVLGALAQLGTLRSMAASMTLSYRSHVACDDCRAVTDWQHTAVHVCHVTEQHTVVVTWCFGGHQHMQWRLYVA
jgi:hypothetical protein